MAAGPLHLLEAGIVTDQRYAGAGSAPAALGGAVAEHLRPAKRVKIPFQPRDRWLTSARESCRALADAVTASLAADALPIVLGGECTVIAGTITGALAVERDLALLYFDAHADFNTLATTPSHYVGGMCLAHVCGRHVAPLLWPGVRTMREEHVALVGAREIDPGEARNLAASRVTRIPFDGGHPDALGLLAFARRRPVWIHVDVDIIDPRDMPAVAGPVADGPPLSALSEVLRSVAAVSDVRGIELCGYDPTKDPGARLVGPLAELIAVTVGETSLARR